MITSKFFEPDHTVGDNLGTSIFRYQPFVLMENDRPGQRPVYLAFKTDSIEFNFQGKIASSVKDKPEIYVSVPLLSIPLSEKPGDDIMAAIQKIYLHRTSINPLNSKETHNGSEVRLRYQLEDFEGSCYSKLGAFDMKNNSHWKDVQWNEESSLKNKFLRKLFLDFLEDFFHANVFRLTPKYQAIRNSLLKCNSIRGIQLKADLYQKYEWLVHAEKKDKLASSLYFEAMEEWTKFVCDKENAALFPAEKKEKGGWFDYSDQELTKALLWSTKFATHTHKCKSGIVKRAINDLVRNYEIAKAGLLLLTSGYFSVGIFVLALFIFLSWTFLLPLTAHVSLLHYYRNTLGFILSLAFGIPLTYQLSTKIKFLKKDRFSHLLFFVPIVLWLGWLYTGKRIEMLYDSNWSFLVLFLGGFFILGCILFAVSLVKPVAINILLPRLQMAVITSWLAILPSLDIWKNYFDITIREGLGYGLLLIVVTSSYLLFQIRRNTRLINKTKLTWKLLNVILPGYLLSLTIGLGGMSIMSKKYMLHSDFFENKIVRENIFELKTYDSLKSARYEKNLRAALLNTPGNLQIQKAALSEIIDYKTKPGKEESKDSLYPRADSLHLIENGLPSHQRFIYVHRVAPGIQLVVIPGFLFLMSSIALFSGIFLTLLFDDKPITDPL